MALQPVTDVYQFSETNKSSVYSMGLGPELTWYKLPAYNDSGFTSSQLSHIWGYLGMYNETSINTANLPQSQGGLIGTALERLGGAFETTGAIVFSVTNSNYRVSIDGTNIALLIPLDSNYSGVTSGISATTLFSSYIYNPDILNKNPASLCSPSNADSYISEPSQKYTAELGIGYEYVPGTNPNTSANYPYFDSGITYLVSDSIYKIFTGATGSSLSWSYGYNVPNKYQNGAQLISFDPSNFDPNGFIGTGGYDIIVGAVFNNFGFGIIWDPNLVGAFKWSASTGNYNSISGATFSSGDTIFNAADLDFAEKVRVKVVMDAQQFNQSANPSYIGLGSNTDCGVAFTNLTLHDELGNCLAIARIDEAVIKTEGQYKIFDIDIPVSGDITDSLADTRGLLYNP
jgi:hypothetical protein